MAVEDVGADAEACQVIRRSARACRVEDIICGDSGNPYHAYYNAFSEVKLRLRLRNASVVRTVYRACPV